MESGNHAALFLSETKLSHFSHHMITPIHYWQHIMNPVGKKILVLVKITPYRGKTFRPDDALLCCRQSAAIVFTSHARIGVFVRPEN